MNAPAGGVPWRGIAVLGGLLIAVYGAWERVPPNGTPAASAFAPFVDSAGRVDFTRIGVMGAVFAAACAAVAWVLAPHFKARERSVRMSDPSQWAEDVCSSAYADPVRFSKAIQHAIESNPELSRAVILRLFTVETEERKEALRVGREAQREVGEIHRLLSDSHILTDVPQILNGLRTVTDSMGELAKEFRKLVETRQTERVSDRYEMGMLRATVQQIEQQTMYRASDGKDYPNRRGNEDRRHPDPMSPPNGKVDP